METMGSEQTTGAASSLPAVDGAKFAARGAAGPPARAGTTPTADPRLLRWFIRRRLAKDPEYAIGSHALAQAPDLVDFLIAGSADPHAPEAVFAQLRWGGQFVFVSRDPRSVAETARQFLEWHGGGAWVIEQGPATLCKYPLNLPLLFVHQQVHYFIARKVMLVGPGESSERFTYHVHLQKNEETGEYEVIKQVPTLERVLARLREKFPEADVETLKRRARKFTEKIFPVFLTRETAILKLLQRDLPARFRHKVPRVLYADQDPQGYVRTLHLKWLRNGGKPLTQLEFARQSAELLAALHDDAKVIHLDLRLDNFVITPNGVGFIDFGSAVRVGEAFPEASLLSNLFGEMMRTSQIQRMLGKMTEAGQVTSEEICNSYHRIDKAVDFFYLAVQINAPHSNPDFKGLIKFNPHSAEAHELSKLTEQILRPSDVDNAPFKSARDILQGILEIKRKLRK